MHIIVCVDDKNGMLFFGKRQSRDRVLCAYLTERYGTLYVNSYSAPLFETCAAEVEVFPKDGTVFIENIPPSSLGSPEKITVCRWNRAYPADMYLDIPLDGYRLVDTADIVGSSHERITVEEYEKTV